MSISTTTSYKEVQLAFRQLALRHHPDTASSQQHGDGDDTDHNDGAMTSSSFTDIREAFEAIIEGPNGEAILRKNNDYTSSFNHNTQYRDNDEEKYNNNDNKRPPPHDSDDLFHSSLDLDPQILREVAQVAEEMNPAGLDKGGMWAYANMVNLAKRDGLPPLRVGNGGGGVVDEDNKNRSGVARRRRKRR